jgi:hypothetical protein
MVASTRDSFTKMKFRASESIFGPMVRRLKANGSKIKCTEMANCSGKMARNIRVNSKMTRGKVMAYSPGEMVEFMMANGVMENSMAAVSSLKQREQGAQESGRMVATSIGLTKRLNEQF